MFLGKFPKFFFSYKLCEGSTSYAHRNGMKFIQCLHMPKLSPSSKLQLNQIIYVSPASIFIFYPNWNIAKQVLFIPLLLPSKFLVNLPYPNNCHIPIFNSICLVNLPWKISKVSI